MRVLTSNEDEMERMAYCIERAVFHDEVLHHRLLHKFDVALVELLQYIPGHSLC